MSEAQKRLDQAFKWLSRVTVSGESVDCLAMARQELRAAYQVMEKEDGNGGQDNR